MTLFPVVVLLALVSSGVSRSLGKRDAQDSDWNAAIGDLVRSVAADMVAKEGSFFSIPDLSDTFGGWFIDGKLTASNGTIGNFSTLQFVNLTVSTTADSLTVFVQVRLERLQLAYSSFDASVRILSVSGGVSVTVDSNLLTAQVTLSLDDDCQASLDLLELTEFSGIALTITGVDHINERFVSKIATAVVNRIAPDLKPMAEEKLRELVLPYVSLACDYLE